MFQPTSASKTYSEAPQIPTCGALAEEDLASALEQLETEAERPFQQQVEPASLGCAATTTQSTETPTTQPLEPIACLIPHELKGEWLPGVEEMEREVMAMSEQAGFTNMNPRNYLQRRAKFNAQGDMTAMHMAPQLEQCDTEVITVDATQYGGSKPEMQIYIHRPKGLQPGGPAFIYFHGGAFVLNSAYRTQPVAANWAVNCGCTCFGVDYGTAPETKAPDSGLNCYAAVKYVSAHAKQLAVDRTRLVIGGESAGGAHTAMCCYQLAKRNESSLVKFALVDIAAVSSHWLDRSESNCLNWLEWANTCAQFGVFECVIKTDKVFSEGEDELEFSRGVFADHKDDPEVFPVKMSDNLARRCPPTVVTTREFDMYRRDSLEYAELMRRNGRLLMEPYVQPGSSHMGAFAGMPGTKQLYGAFKRIYDHFIDLDRPQS